VRVVRAELLAERVADLSDSAHGGQRFAHRRQEIPVSPSGLAKPRERGFRGLSVPLGAHSLRALDLAPLGVRIRARSPIASSSSAA
jgi:hypothetical protein